LLNNKIFFIGVAVKDKSGFVEDFTMKKDTDDDYRKYNFSRDAELLYLIEMK